MHVMNRTFVGAAAITLALSTGAMAAEPVTPKLTDKLSQLLQQEMRSVQAAMASIHTAMVTGEHDTVATSAQQIHDSFILQQSLTTQDRKDLMAAVPDGFIKLDKEFHSLAASLADAGRKQQTRKQNRLYNEMTRNCIACHGKYVSDRFPGVSGSKN